MVDFELLRRCTPELDPFPYLIVPGFVREEMRGGIREDYPIISHRGSFPLASLQYGPRFAALIDVLTGPEMAALVERKLGTDLAGRPTTVTVRGISDGRDGHIHTDSRSKLVTLLLYMNSEWEAQRGRLRLLRTPDNLQDFVAEVPPDCGTMLLFKNTPNAWHGFEPFEGPRRVIQVNWVTGGGVLWRETLRHRLSAFTKHHLRKKQSSGGG